MNSSLQHAMNSNHYNEVDPTTVLVNKLASGQDLFVRIQTETDNVIVKHSEKSSTNSLRINVNVENPQLPKLRRIFEVFSNRRSSKFPTQEQKFVIEKLKSIPVHVVVNGNNEVVMASPRKSFTVGSLQWLCNKYNELFFWSRDEGPITVALFFMHLEDAESYLHEICRKEPRESETLGLKVFTTGLDLFYRFNRTSPPKIQCRLVADLNEIDNVLGSQLRICSVHPKQRYSTEWFQGSPVYMFKLNLPNKNGKLSECNFYNNSRKKMVFFSKKDALKAWSVYISRHSQADFGKRPHLEIYNLEGLLHDLECHFTDVHLVPPYNPYRNLTKDIDFADSNQYTLLEKHLHRAKLTIMNFKRFYKGLTWLLTSDTLPNEDNSW
uniref:Uncharacterized protein n=1 Tax=Cryptomonas sp. CCAC 1634B TaxID=2051848 RepID=A0A679CAH5_9CRYP|nr:hypothetical protein CryM1634B_p103 [Cryptomonas sp. CCAC 1634B]